MGATINLYFYFGILQIMAPQVLTENRLNFLRVNGGSNAMLSFIELCQYSRIYIVINQNNALIGRFDKLRYYHISIKYLALKQNTFFGR